MARQYTILTPLGPVTVNETGSRQASVMGATLNETSATGPYIYRGASTWSGTRYKGTKTDAQLYKGAKTLHP